MPHRCVIPFVALGLSRAAVALAASSGAPADFEPPATRPTIGPAVVRVGVHVINIGPHQPVLPVGTTTEQLRESESQMGLFVDRSRERQRTLDGLTDKINQKLGKGAIRRGGAR